MYNSHPKLSTLHHLNTQAILGMWFRLFLHSSRDILAFEMRFACFARFCSMWSNDNPTVSSIFTSHLFHWYTHHKILVQYPKMQQDADSKCGLGWGIDSWSMHPLSFWISRLLVFWDSNYPHLMLISFHPSNATGWYFDKCTTHVADRSILDSMNSTTKKCIILAPPRLCWYYFRL